MLLLVTFNAQLPNVQVTPAGTLTPSGFVPKETLATTQTINLQVDRAVARVDVYMRREIGQDENYWENRLYIEELGVDRISDIGFISPVRVPDNRYDNIYFMDRKEIREEVYSDDKGELLYSFYVPEMECIYDKLSLDFHYLYSNPTNNTSYLK